MANSLLKWCKTKILHGYRQINVEGHDEVLSGNRSDTEFLVRGSDDEFLLTPTGSHASCPGDAININELDLSPTMTSSPKVPLNRSRRAIDCKGDTNMSCDLNLTEDPCVNQEFAFTLYDFHGQGRVTRDDIASLVQSIYDTVGSSMSLPPSGSRTVKVKLSVTPSQKGIHFRRRHKHEHKGTKVPLNLNYNTPRNSPRAPFNSDSCSSQGESPRYYCDESSWSSSFRSSPNVTPRQKESPRVRESLASPRQEIFVGEEMTSSQITSARNSSSPTLEPVYDDGNMTPRFPVESEDGGEYEGTKSKNSLKQKKVQYQREELLRLIQTSMEKNNLYYPPLRNPGCGHVHGQNHYRRRKKRYHHHHSSSFCRSCCRCSCSHQHSKCQSNSQLDPVALTAKLIHYDHTLNNSTYEDAADSAEGIRNFIHTVDINDGCSRCQKYQSSDDKKSTHYRSRSQDLNSDSPHVFRHHLLEAPSVYHYHPLPPSNTPDRPTSPHVSYHNHQHSHNHIHQQSRLRSRSCEADDSFKERFSSTAATTSTTAATTNSPEETLLSVQHPINNAFPKIRKNKEYLTMYCPNILSKSKDTKDHFSMNDNELIISEKNFANYSPEYNTRNIENDIFLQSQQTFIKGDASVLNSSLKSTSSRTIDNLIVATKNLGLDDSTSSSTSACGRSHHVHQHYHHHYHHYPSTPLII